MGLFEKCEIRQLTAWKKCCFFVFTFSFFWVSNRCMKSYFSWPSRFHALEWLTFFHKKRTFFRSWIWGAQSFGLNYSTFFLPENEQRENWKFVSFGQIANTGKLVYFRSEKFVTVLFLKKVILTLTSQCGKILTFWQKCRVKVLPHLGCRSQFFFFKKDDHEFVRPKINKFSRICEFSKREKHAPTEPFAKNNHEFPAWRMKPQKKFGNDKKTNHLDQWKSFQGLENVLFWEMTFLSHDLETDIF